MMSRPAPHGWTFAGPGVAAWLACSPTAPPPADAGAPSFTDATADAELDPVCKPTAGAPPEVIVGEGQNDFFPVADLQTVQVEAGPQGGHHIWIALRVKNLLRSGSRTTITALSPATGIEVAPFEVIFTFDPGEGGYCVLFGLRYQLDAGGVDYLPLLGKELDLTVTVTDRAGDGATGSRRVTLSSAVR
jgi:hypothetical protein